MKDSAPDHRKMRKLARLLDVWQVTAMGIMESLWLSVAEYRPDGDITGIESEAISEWCRVQMIHHIEPDNLVKALIDAGFVEHIDSRLIIHDWPEHCSNYVHHKLARRKAFFADGSIPNLTTFWDRKIKREDLVEWYKAAGTRKADAGTRHVPTTAKRVPVSPLPTPTPTPTPLKKQLSSPAAPGVPSTDIKNPPAAASNGSHANSEWQQAQKFLEDKFPQTDAGYAKELASLATVAITRAGGNPAKMTDAVLVDALKASTFPKQQSAAGYKRTLPRVMANWSKPK